MSKLWYLAICIGLILVPIGTLKALQEPAPAAKSQGKSLKITVSYEGKGKVDKDHGIFLFVFDTPDFAQNPGTVMPIAMRTIYANGEPVTLTGLTAANAYLAVLYDEKGGYDITTGPPPSGSPVAVYRTADSQGPSPIKLDEEKEVEVKLTFDDSIRMP